MDKKWNLQDIKPATPKRRRPSEPQPEAAPVQREKQYIDEENDGTMHISIGDGNKKKRSHLVVAAITFIVIVIAGFVASWLMAGAEVTVFPRNREPNINATFEAFKTPQVNELSYEILSLEAEGERQVSAEGQQEVVEQATGSITIFKTTPGTERLIKNTRFASPDGLIFRITESVVVPGATENAEGELVPGSISAAVFADEAGEEYNLGTTRFTIPGFAEGGFTELFEAMYAENTEAFTGGFNGQRFTIDENELETAKQALQMELRDALLARVPNERPAGFVLFDSAITFTYQSLPTVEYGENLATIKEVARLQVPLFKDEGFAEYLAAASVPGYEGEPVRIEDTSVLAFTYSSATTTSADIGNLDSLSFRLTGKPLLVWTFDEGRLKADLLNAPKTALNTILGGYPAIERAQAVIRPFWARSFPADLEEIKLIEELTQAE